MRITAGGWPSCVSSRSRRERREGERERRLTELAERFERSDAQLFLGRLCEGDDAAQDRDGDDLTAVAERWAREGDERSDEAQRLGLLGVVLGVAREGAVRGKRGRVRACALDDTSREGRTHRTRKSGRWCSFRRMASDASTKRWRTRRYIAARTSLPAESARHAMILRTRASASTRCEERGVMRGTHEGRCSSSEISSLRNGNCSTTSTTSSMSCTRSYASPRSPSRRRATIRRSSASWACVGGSGAARG
mgnify:CR=1 FL=1